MRHIDQLYLHCSACSWGDFDQIDGWHKERNFPEYQDPYRQGETHYVGYHYLVMGPFVSQAQFSKWKNSGVVSSITDGKLVPCRPIEFRGAHVAGANYRSIGVAYVGFTPTPLQLETLLNLTTDLVLQLNLDLDTGVLGHHEFFLRNGKAMAKTCPNMDMAAFRKAVDSRLNTRLR